MNGFEMAVAWLAIQVGLALLPAAGLHLWASRRGPAQGAWVAVASLAVVLALSAASIDPWPRARPAETTLAPRVAESLDAKGERHKSVAVGAGEGSRPGRSAVSPRGLIWSQARFARWVESLQHGASRSARRYPRGTGVAASLIVAGAAIGVLRLIIGLGGIALCRRRGKRIEDPALLGLLDRLGDEMGCRAAVELREMPDLGTAATAGWRRPLILLPDDWRSWDDGERRAVLAHELAHIVRGDYAAGLMARLALSLHFYHPLVRWMAGRLLAQQELAADALGARFAGGRDSYVLALSRLALRQDGRASFWPARAFLPTKGTLIRRIEMLTSLKSKADRPWSRKGRVSAASLLLCFGVGVFALPGPSRGGDEAATKVAIKESAGPAKPRDRKTAPAIDLSYLPADAKGFIAIQPAAICRREGMGALVAQMNTNPDSKELLWLALMEFGCFPYVEFSTTQYTKHDMPTTNSRFRIDEVEQISNHFTVDTVVNQGKQLRRINTYGHVIRMVEAFDWEKQARIWWPKMTAVRELRRVYFKVNSQQYVEKMCVFLPDDRTIVIDSEANVRGFINRESANPPAFIKELDWTKISQSLFALAIDNHDHRMAGILKTEPGRDAVDVSRLFEQADLWAFHLEDSDAFRLKAWATCASTDKSRLIAIAFEDSLIEMQRLTFQPFKSPESMSEVQQMFAKILEGYEVVPSGTTVDVIPKPAVKLAEFFRVLGLHAAKDVEVHSRAESK